jgi:hypothetical protein
MISPDEVKVILNIDDDEIENDALNQYITRYTKVIMSKLGDWAKLDTSLYNDPLFEECLLAIIACQLSRTDIGMIHAPSEYKVGDTTLKYNNTSMGLYGAIPSWCDYYNSLLSALLGRKSELQKVRPLRRHGMACHPKWWHI